MTEPHPVPYAAPAPGPLDPWPGEVTWRPVSPRLVWLELTRVVINTAVLLAACAVVGVLWSTRWAVIGAVVVVVLDVTRAVVAVRAARSYGYAERERDLLVRHGRMVRHLSIVPYARMQFVDVVAGPLERAFGLATVQLHTAAAASDATVPGLEPAEAARLRDRLAALGEDAGEGL
ncbi:PH domain-containing protein [Catellatospora bangladeshensis]|uniref:Membrane protein n=1 Tax=Catellatospora bangladeshensis TaxID=310355 RepID=A0A8J3JFH8_9ACTN|nr:MULTISPECIES: PH domain-containing protein [Catellatospora]BCJ77609.1 membrane protein [Catellatospora sp. IY07-71]GIF81689.1 membrane protein [Catellatospora bangladeshensis]